MCDYPNYSQEDDSCFEPEPIDYVNEAIIHALAGMPPIHIDGMYLAIYGIYAGEDQSYCHYNGSVRWTEPL